MKNKKFSDIAYDFLQSPASKVEPGIIHASLIQGLLDEISSLKKDIDHQRSDLE